MPYTITEFARKVKGKYPYYKDIDDDILVEKIVVKYPDYKDWIVSPPVDLGSVKPPDMEAEFTPEQLREMRQVKSDLQLAADAFLDSEGGDETVMDKYKVRAPAELKPYEEGESRPVDLPGVPAYPQGPEMRAFSEQLDTGVIRAEEAKDISLPGRIGRTVAGTTGQMITAAGQIEQYAGRKAKRAGMGYKELSKQVGDDAALALIGKFYEKTGTALEMGGEFTAGKGRELAEKMAYQNPQFLDKAVAGLTTTATSLLPSIGLVKLAGLLKYSPAIANALGISLNVILESSLESGFAREDMINKGASEDEADKAAEKVFFSNIPIIAITDKLGVFAKTKTMVGKFARSAIVNAGQEALQQAPINVVTGKRITAGMGESALIGGLVGGPFGILESVAERIPAPGPRITINPNATPQNLEKARVMATTDPIAALKSVAPTAEWAKIDALAGNIVKSIENDPSVPPEQKKSISQQVLASILERNIAPVTPEALQGQMVAEDQAQAGPVAEMEVMQTAAQKMGLTAEDLDVLLPDKEAGLKILADIVQRGQAEGLNTDQMADEFATMIMPEEVAPERTEGATKELAIDEMRSVSPEDRPTIPEAGLQFDAEEFAKEKKVIKERKTPNTVLYHGTNAPTEKIEREGLKLPDRGGYQSEGEIGVFSSKDIDYAKTYGKNIIKIDISKMNVLSGKNALADTIVEELYAADDRGDSVRAVVDKYAAQGIDAVEMADGIIFFRDVKPSEIIANAESPIKTSTTEKLKSLGYSEEEAQANAEVLSAYYKSEAGRQGKTEEQFLKDNPLPGITDKGIVPGKEELEQGGKYNKSLEKRAVKHFGTTEDYMEGGYLLTNGTMLDFSGKKEGGTAGHHDMDHSEISFAYTESEIKETKKRHPERNDSKVDFMEDTGAIRMFVLNDSINIHAATTPTTEQLTEIGNMLTERNPDYLSLDKEYGKNKSEIMDKPTIDDIKRFFSEGSGTTLFQSPAESFGDIAPVFYSQVQRVIEQKMGGSATAEQIKGMLSPQNGVRQEELDWVDLDGFLKDNPKPTKAQVLEYLAANSLEIEEVNLGKREELGYAVSDTKFSQYQLPGGENYREVFLTAPGIKQKWMDGHPQYSDVENPVIRLRINDRVADGKKILFIEEVQGPKESEQEKMPGFFQGPKGMEKGMKRVIRMAAEQGYDAVAWTTGEIQAERYDLSKQVDRISYLPEEQKLRVFSLDGKMVVDETVVKEKVQDFIGKEAARKLLESPVTEANGHYLQGADLKIGGESMARVYDQIIPSFVNKFTKKWGGKVENVNISSSKQPPFAGTFRTQESANKWIKENNAEERAYSKLRPNERDWVIYEKGSDLVYLGETPTKENVHSLALTPAMKEAALKQGFPLFQESQSGARGFYSQADNLIGLLKNKDQSSFMHESAHAWLTGIWQYVQSGRADERYIAHWKPMAEWLGVKEGQKGITREQQEKFAKGFEAYLREGKAPIPALKRAFLQFRAWLIQIYKRATDLNVELSDEARAFYGRLLGSEKQEFQAVIQKAKEAQDRGELVLGQEPININTPEFKAWFGDSKVVDEKGRPLVVYHGTNVQDLNEFKPSKGLRESIIGGGKEVESTVFFFTPKKNVAGFFAKNRADYYLNMPWKGKVLDVYLSIKNPINLTQKNQSTISKLEKAGIDIYEYFGYKTQDYINNKIPSNLDAEPSYFWKIFDKPEFVQKLKNAGYDGAITNEGKKGFNEENKKESMGISYVVFSPSQIKSTSNIGTFDPKNPNILMQEPAKRTIHRATGFTPQEQAVLINQSKLLRLRLSSEARAARVAARATKAEVIEDLRAKRKDTEAIRKEVRDYVLKNVPSEARGRFLTTVEQAKTTTDLGKAIIKADNAAEKARRKAIIADIKKVAGRAIESGKVDVEYREAIKVLISEIDLTERRPETILKLKAMRDYIERRKASGRAEFIPDNISKALEILIRKPVGEISEIELENILRDLHIIEFVGKEEQAKKEEAWALDKNMWVEDLSKLGIKHINLPAEANKLQKGTAWSQEIYWSVAPMRVIADRLDGGKGTYDGAHSVMYEVLAVRDFERYYNMVREYIDPVMDLIEKHKMTEEQMEKIGIYAFKVQKDGIGRVLATRPELTEKYVRELTLTAPEMEVYNKMRTAMETLYPFVKRLMGVLYNKPMGKVDGYFSMQTDWKKLKDMDVLSRLTQSGEEWEGARKNITAGYTKERKPGAFTPIKINALKIFLQHINDVSYFIAMQEDIKKFSEIVDDDRYKTAVGPQGHKIIRSWLDLLARKGKAEGSDKLHWLSTMRKNISASVLGLKLSSFLIQSTSFFDAASYVGGANVLNAWAQIIGNKPAVDWLKKEFPKFRERVLDDTSYIELSEQELLKKVQRLGYVPMKELDGTIAASTVIAAYGKKCKELGVEIDYTKPANAKAARYANRVLASTQASPFFVDLGIMFGSAKYGLGNVELNKALLQFKQFITSRWFYMTYDVPKMPPGDRVNAYAWLLAANAAEMGIRGGSKAIVLGGLGLFGMGIAKGVSSADDDDDMYKKYVLNLLGQVPFAGWAIDAFNYQSLPIPVVDTISQFIEGTGDALRAQNEYKKVVGLRQSLISLAKLMGIPGTAQVGQVLAWSYNPKTLTFPYNAEQAELKALGGARTASERERFILLNSKETQFSVQARIYRDSMERGNLETAKKAADRAAEILGGL